MLVRLPGGRPVFVGVRAAAAHLLARTRAWYVEYARPFVSNQAVKRGTLARVVLSSACNIDIAAAL